MRRRTSACDARNQLETSSCSCGLVLARRPSTSGRETGSDARLPSGSTANGTSGSPATEGVAQALQGVVPTRRTSRPARPRIRCLACGQPASSPDAKTLTRSPRGNARLPTLPSAWSSTWPWKPLSEYSSKTPISPKAGRTPQLAERPIAYAQPGRVLPEHGLHERRCGLTPRRSERRQGGRAPAAADAQCEAIVCRASICAVRAPYLQYMASAKQKKRKQARRSHHAANRIGVPLFEHLTDILEGRRQMPESDAVYQHYVPQLHLRGFSSNPRPAKNALHLGPG